MATDYSDGQINGKTSIIDARRHVWQERPEILYQSCIRNPLHERENPLRRDKSRGNPRMLPASRM
jgi:hypothetical protein